MKKYDLAQLAKKAMEARGLQPEFPKEALEQLATIKDPAPCTEKCEDLTELLWCSIDNDNSRDLDQITYAEKETDGTTTLWIGVADVDALVPQNSPLDIHAQFNTTSVYTPAKVFPMFPEKLSTNLTSLNEDEDRIAIVVKVSMSSVGEIKASSIFRATVRNKAKLAYKAVGAWLEDEADAPNKVKEVPGLAEALRCQSEATQTLKERRHALGALTLEPSEAEAILENGEVRLERPGYNFAHQLIEHFMIAANHAMANQLNKAQIPSLRRIVRTPNRWDKIREIAARLSTELPEKPDSKALETFLVEQKKRNPDGFPDLSLTVIKLLGRGEYVVESPGDAPIGHFGLALSAYTHSTAPNRRFPDLITQRQYKAFLSGKGNPYPPEELRLLAAHCTEQEDAAMKVERHAIKSAAALFLSSQIGAYFHAIVTGAGPKGTWVRIFSPPVEGRVIHGFDRLDVGDRVTVKLISVDIPKGFINFAAKR